MGNVSMLWTEWALKKAQLLYNPEGEQLKLKKKKNQYVTSRFAVIDA